MELRKDFVFENLHLFETSILGDYYLNNNINDNHVIIPCYNPQLVTINDVNYYSERSYLIFKDVEYLICENNLYDETGKTFINKIISSKLILESDFHSQLFKLSNLGLTSAGKGWVNYSILAKEFIVVANSFLMGQFEPDILSKIKDEEIIDFLNNPKNEQVISLLNN